ncbi:hypothetical protein [Thermoactinomyces sp. CICC 10521]|jgi:hypothetical protein|uniref:hypothetical protein n=1 Tax=Thermoactinomyces sp. CICC 10521 TaxID=2767426 RepID=UPI0018DCA06D|nr:hypothetical protein [Thermoactinomyces sp. CICC 10521]MBH8608496.1 hypothetical protein [Thermoactinomyces sp. CICC 10521]
MNRKRRGTFTEVHHEVHHEVHNERHYEGVDPGWFKIGKPFPEMGPAPPQHDPGRMVLVYLDLEEELLAAAGPVAHSGLMKRMIVLGRLAGIFQMPALISLLRTEKGSRRGVLEQKLHSLFPAVPILPRTETNAWEHCDFVGAIRQTKCKSLILAGIGLDPAAVFTALTAVSQGYQVFMVIGEEEEKTVVTESVIQQMILAGVCLISWKTLAFVLQRDWCLPTSSSVLDLFSEFE